MILYYQDTFQLHTSLWLGKRRAEGGKVWKTPDIPCGLSGMTRICQERWGGGGGVTSGMTEKGLKEVRERGRGWLGNKGQGKKEWADWIR